MNLWEESKEQYTGSFSVSMGRGNIFWTSIIFLVGFSVCMEFVGQQSSAWKLIKMDEVREPWNNISTQTVYNYLNSDCLCLSSLLYFYLATNHCLFCDKWLVHLIKIDDWVWLTLLISSNWQPSQLHLYS